MDHSGVSGGARRDRAPLSLALHPRAGAVLRGRATGRVGGSGRRERRSGV